MHILLKQIIIHISIILLIGSFGIGSVWILIQLMIHIIYIVLQQFARLKAIIRSDSHRL